jgi:hypothetical protein
MNLDDVIKLLSSLSSMIVYINTRQKVHLEYLAKLLGKTEATDGQSW